MKKFKLIKEYPGSPKLGTVITATNTNGWGHTYKIACNYTEFWEEVFEKNYQILTVVLTGSYNRRISNVSESSDIYINRLLACKGNHIHSVKRLSDGKVFTVGDVTEHKEWNSIGVIKGFRLLDNTTDLVTWINWDIKNNVCDDSEAFLKDLEHYVVKQPIFISADGVEMFIGSKIWSIHKQSLQYCSTGENSLYSTFKPNPDFIYFSNAEKAEEYIRINKKQLSFKDIEHLLTKKGKETLLKRLLNGEVKKIS